MSAVFPNTVYTPNPNQVVNVSMQVDKPCPPVFISYIHGSTIGWNAVLVGLLSSLLAIAFLLTCLYYLAFRRRLVKEMPDELSPVPMVDKVAASTIPVTSASQSVSTTILHESSKETKINSYSEQISGPLPSGDFAIAMSGNSNGHVGSNGSPGLLTNGNTDPSELRLLQHEHH